MKNITYLTDHKSIAKNIIIAIGSFLLGFGVRYAIFYIDFDTETTIEWNGGKYTGEVTDGQPDGEGTFVRDNITYSGTWANGNTFNGTVTSDKYIYEGDVVDLKFNGFGVCRYKEGSIYWGYWKDDNKEGIGKLRNVDGSIDFGIFKNGAITKKETPFFNAGDQVYGIDVSHHQGIIKWQDLYFETDKFGNVHKRNSGKEYMRPVLFAFAKSTEGATIKDDLYTLNRVEARKSGIMFGAYHFYSMTSSAKDQAENFISNTTLETGDFPPVLDLEKIEYRRKISDDEFRPVVESAKEWLKIVENHYGARPVIYTTVNVYKKFIANDIFFCNYDLWIANPGSIKPNIPNCILWQFSHKWLINGIDSYVDTNCFIGDYKSLVDYIQQKGIK